MKNIRIKSKANFELRKKKDEEEKLYNLIKNCERVFEEHHVKLMKKKLDIRNLKITYRKIKKSKT
jgi:hypothetical protein